MKGVKFPSFFYLGAVVAIVLLVFWILWIGPRFLWLPDNFSYSAGVESFDNFYDESTGSFIGEERTVTHFDYEIEEREGNIMTIKNTFAVRTVFGDPVFSVERRYGVDRRTGKHVVGYGDKDRDGYLFAPRGLKPGNEYLYWHINYDTPAHMIFDGEEELHGMRVLRFRSEDLSADQTQDLHHLPGVPDERGVRLAVDLKTWVEPVTGYLVKYEDRTLASYYDLKSGQVLHPWNNFHNQYNEISIMNHVAQARYLKQQQLVVTWLVPGVLLLTVAGLLSFGIHSKRRHDS